MDDAVARVMELYPRIFFACHRRHVRDPATRKTLSDHQASILDHLDEVDPITLTALARHMGVTPGTMSLSIDRLERRKYVRRQRDVADRRRVLLRLTPAGVRLRDSRTVLEPERVAAMLERLAPERREAALEGLALLAAAASELVQAHKARPPRPPRPPQELHMKLLLIALPLVFALIAAIATIVIGGMFISRTHSATRSVRLSAARERVWEVVADFPNHLSWRPGLKSIERGADMNGHPVWMETTKHGDKMPIEIVEFAPPARMVGRIADPSLPFGGTWTYELSPDGAGGGTRLRITEDGEVRPPAFRYIARAMGYHGTIEKYLGALAGKLGENAAIEP